jgi:hypothetical protein
VGVEIWDASGKGRVVDLRAELPRLGGRSTLVAAKSGDEAWILSAGVVLRYADGKVERAAGPGPSVRNLFVSETGELHASAGRALWRRAGTGWVEVARLAWPTTFRAIEVERGVFWAIVETGVQTLRPGEGIDFRDGCKTPLVHLSDVSQEAPPRYAFPATQKALSTFAEVKELGLVEFTAAGSRRLGVTVKSRAQGEAVVRHMREAMKEDDPVLVCHAPNDARTIAWKH